MPPPSEIQDALALVKLGHGDGILPQPSEAMMACRAARRVRAE